MILIFKYFTIILQNHTLISSLDSEYLNIKKYFLFQLTYCKKSTYLYNINRSAAFIFLNLL